MSVCGIRYTKNGLIATAGFSDPNKDPLEDDLKLWMPDDENPPKELDLRMSRYLLAQVGDQFCDLYQQERDAMSHHMSDGKRMEIFFRILCLTVRSNLRR